MRTHAKTARQRSFLGVPAAGPPVALALATPSGSVPVVHSPKNDMKSVPEQFCVSHDWQSGPPTIAMPPEPDEALEPPEPPEPDPDAALPPEPEALPPEPDELDAASLASALAVASDFASELALSLAASTTEVSALASF